VYVAFFPAFLRKYLKFSPPQLTTRSTPFKQEFTSLHCHYHLLQLAYVQAANNTQGIKHVYTTLTTLCKYFHYSPKRAECLKEIQRVLEMSDSQAL